MNIKQYPLARGQWFGDLTRKKYVVGHGTGGRTRHTRVSGRPGRATTSIDGWNLSADRVGAPWLVDRDGTIYKTFDDAGWIYHLGIKGTNGRYDRSSVAIELANEGALDFDGDRLYAFGFHTPSTVYRGPFLNYDWRGSTCFAQLDEAQVDAAIERTLDVCRRHDIEPVFYYPSTTYDFPRCFHVATIICHSNCRPDKLDLSAGVGVRKDRGGGGTAGVVTCAVRRAPVSTCGVDACVASSGCMAPFPAREIRSGCHFPVQQMRTTAWRRTCRSVIPQSFRAFSGVLCDEGKSISTAPVSYTSTIAKGQIYFPA